MEQSVLLGGIVIAILTTVAVVFIAKNARAKNKIEELEIQIASLFTVGEMIHYRDRFESDVIKSANHSGLVPNFPLWLRRKFDDDLIDGLIDDETCHEREVEKIHEFFGLSYANYLVIPRSVLQSTSPFIQDEIVSVLGKIKNNVGDWEAGRGHYSVRYRDTNNKFAKDDLKDYQRGSRIVNFK